ncbi:MAG TPA: four helix bundle protein [Gemmatimonadales bacterium]|nr:four helix bundle protein [Gemmatimonadales bacterium]
MEADSPARTGGLQNHFHLARRRTLFSAAQTRRAALSAPTNIAEGAAKRGLREFRRYLDISLGSLSELSYLLRFSKDCGVLDEETFQSLEELRSKAGVLTWRLYRCLGRSSHA